MELETIQKQTSDVSLWTEDKWKTVREMFIPKGVSKENAEMFIELSKAYGLNPFKKEIWIIPFGNRCNIFAGRDGFLSIAHRSGMFNGMNTTFGYDKNNMLDWAETTVYNKSMQYPIIHRAFLCEYTTGQNLWKKMARTMLQKVAESSALRRAFNINGLYAPEEIDQEAPQIINAAEKSIKLVTDLPKEVPKHNDVDASTVLNVKDDIIPGSAQEKVINGCMVVWCTENNLDITGIEYVYQKPMMDFNEADREKLKKEAKLFIREN
jgi:phage recombination protein Bet